MKTFVVIAAVAFAAVYHPWLTIVVWLIMGTICGIGTATFWCVINAPPYWDLEPANLRMKRFLLLYLTGYLDWPFVLLKLGDAYMDWKDKKSNNQRKAA